MITNLDKLEVVLQQDLDGNKILNVFQYIIKNVSSGLQYVEVAIDILQFVVDAIKSLQTTALTHEQITINNLSNGLDTFVLGINVSGGISIGAPSPNFVAGSIKLVPANKSVRPGGKRIGGITESAVTDNAWDYNATNMQILTDLLSNDIPINGAFGGTGDLEPVIIGRTLTGAYDLNRVVTIIEAIPNSRITHQNTRKAGTGI